MLRDAGSGFLALSPLFLATAASLTQSGGQKTHWCSKEWGYMMGTAKSSGKKPSWQEMPWGPKEKG